MDIKLHVLHNFKYKKKDSNHSQEKKLFMCEVNKLQNNQMSWLTQKFDLSRITLSSSEVKM